MLFLMQEQILALSHNYMILFILLLSIFFYTYFYSISTNEVSLVIDGMKEGMQITDEEVGILDSFYDVITSMYFQIPLEFIQSLIFVYGVGLFILIFNKIEAKTRNLQQKDNSYSYIVSCFYKSMYVLIIDYVLQGTFLNITGQSLQVFNFSFFFTYWLFLAFYNFISLAKNFIR